MYTHLTEIEADYRREQIAEEFRNAQRRHRRLHRTYQDRRWQGLSVTPRDAIDTIARAVPAVRPPCRRASASKRTVGDEMP